MQHRYLGFSSWLCFSKYVWEGPGRLTCPRHYLFLLEVYLPRWQVFYISENIQVGKHLYRQVHLGGLIFFLPFFCGNKEPCTRPWSYSLANPVCTWGHAEPRHGLGTSVLPVPGKHLALLGWGSRVTLWIPCLTIQMCLRCAHKEPYSCSYLFDLVLLIFLNSKGRVLSLLASGWTAEDR